MTHQSWQPDLPSKVSRVRWSVTDRHGIDLWVKRDDLIHDWVSGNKYRKLKYNLELVKSGGYIGIITFGGPFSNHIYAVAGACKLEGIPCAGIIRGDGMDENNPTLSFCKSSGMELHFVSRSAYTEKGKSEIIHHILAQYPNYQLVPEGGSNEAGVVGASEIMSEFYNQCDVIPDKIIVAVGTGGTAAGIVRSIMPDSSLWAYGALQSDHLKAEIIKLNGSGQLPESFRYFPESHFGGYAKWNQTLLDFITHFESETQIEVDHIYNGKMMYAFREHVTSGKISPGSTVLWIHTGGLQGKAGLTYHMSKKQNSKIIF